MILTEGVRFSGYRLYLLKGEPVLLYNYLDPALMLGGATAARPGKCTIVFDFKYHGRSVLDARCGIRIRSSMEQWNHMLNEVTELATRTFVPRRAFRRPAVPVHGCIHPPPRPLCQAITEQARFNRQPRGLGYQYPSRDAAAGHQWECVSRAEATLFFCLHRLPRKF